LLLRKINRTAVLRIPKNNPDASHIQFKDERGV